MLLITVTIFVIAASPAQAADTYVGLWHDQKHKTKGTLKAVFTKGKKQWTGVFTGIGMGKKFKYTINFTERVTAGKRVFLGDPTIDGSRYRWAAYLVGDKLTATYQAANGNYGTFTASKR